MQHDCIEPGCCSPDHNYRKDFSAKLSARKPLEFHLSVHQLTQSVQSWMTMTSSVSPLSLFHVSNFKGLKHQPSTSKDRKRREQSQQRRSFVFNNEPVCSRLHCLYLSQSLRWLYGPVFVFGVMCVSSCLVLVPVICRNNHHHGECSLIYSLSPCWAITL